MAILASQLTVGIQVSAFPELDLQIIGNSTEGWQEH